MHGSCGSRVSRWSGFSPQPRDFGRYGFEVFMLDAKRKIAIALTILGTGFCILLFAFNVEQLWIVWLLTVGFFAGSSLSPRMTPIALAVCLMAPTSIVMTIIARSLPLYSLHWSGADTIEIATLAEDWKIVITDQTEINSVMGFGAAGHYESIVKCGNSLHLYVTHGNTKTGYYIHGDTVGRVREDSRRRYSCRNSKACEIVLKI